MNFVQRVGVAATTGALLVGATTGPAHAEDLEPPGDTAPLVGMAFAGATDTLWLAGRVGSGTRVEGRPALDRRHR